ncbi:hypothetical protein BGX27_003734, partial [Mortierella sp. AM989]
KLLEVPIEKATRNDSEPGHFYSKEEVSNNNNNSDYGNDSVNDSVNDNDNNSNSDSNEDNNSNSDGNSGKGKGKGGANKDNDKNKNKNKDKNKDKKNRSGLVYYCQMVTKPATATQPAVRCGKKYTLKTNNRSRKRHLDTAHPGVRTTMCNFRLLQLTVQTPEKLISNREPDSAMQPCNCGGVERDQQ